MDDKQFQQLKTEFAADVAAVTKALRDFAVAWKPRDDEIKTCTPAQMAELSELADTIDVALDEIS